MSKYIPADKLISEIEMWRDKAKEKYNKNLYSMGRCDALAEFRNHIVSLQQEQQETEMKSPFTGGKVTILSREEEVTFRGEKIKITRKYYRCVDTGREFTDSKLDDDMMWAVFRAYCEKKGITSFTDIMLRQEQPEVDLEKFTEKIKTFQGRYKHPEIVSIKGAMAFMARMFYQYPNVARQWYDNLSKATMD